MTRSKLKAIVTGRSGAFDLPSIIVAVVAVVLLTLGVLATIFGIIPFAQDNGTRQDIAAVRTAEAVALAKDGKFTDIPGLVSAGYLPEKAAAAQELPANGDGSFLRVDTAEKIKTAAGVNAKGDCYIALGKSGTGKIFWGSDKTSDPQELKPTDDPGCLTTDQLKALVASLGGFEGKYSPLEPVVTGSNPDETHAAFTWNAVESATGYRVESRINGRAWTVIEDNQTETTATVTSNPSDVVDIRVTARNAAGDSGYGTATVKLPDPLIANGGFENGLTSWTPTGTAAPATTAHSGSGAAKLTAHGQTSTLTQSVNVPAAAFSSLDFWYTADNYNGSTSYSRTELQIRDSGGKVLATPFTTAADVSGWTKATVDMTDYKGQNITLALLQFDAGYGVSTASSFDDLVLTSTPPVITDAPTRVGATASDQGASVSWVAPTSRAVPITEYTVTPYLNGAAQTPVKVAGTPAVTTADITGLTNGASYTFTVKATNSAGISPESVASAAVVPGPVKIANAGFEAGLKSWTPAGAATASTSVHSGFGSASLSSGAWGAESSVSQSVDVPADMFSNLDFWYKPSNSNSNNVTEIQIRSTSGTLLATPFATTSSAGAWAKASVDLTDYKGQTVVLKLTQRNTGSYNFGSSIFDDLVFTSTPPVITAAPTRVGATADETSASISWDAPESRSVPITQYTVIPHLNGVAQTPTTVTGSPVPTTATITGLEQGGSYTFTVTATNSAGTSPESIPSSAVTPVAVPIKNAGFEADLTYWTTAGAAATSTTTHSGFGSASLSAGSYGAESSLSQSVNVPADMFSNLDFWYKPSNSNSYNVTEIQIRSTSGTLLATPFATTSSAGAWAKASVDMTDYKGQTVVLKLTQRNTGSYNFGSSIFDDLVFTSTPPVITAAPTRVGATADDTTASLAWAAPSSRAMPITGYTITPYLNGAAQTPTTVTGSPAPTSATITGLTNGASYTFTVAATNSAGTSAPSVASAAVVPGPVKIANAGFEAGLKSWTTAGTTAVSTTTHGGFGSASLSAGSYGAESSLSQSVNVPADMFSNLDFWYLPSNSNSYNVTEIQIRSTSGTLLSTPFATTSSAGAWAKASVDLTDYKGQTVVLKLTQRNTGSYNFGSSIFDDLVFTSTPPVITAAPTRVGATADDTTASLAWAAPASRAMPITGYTITPYLNGAAQTPTTVTGSPAPTSATITGLTNGASYTFTVAASNTAGLSPESAPSAAVIPAPVKIANAGFEAGLSSWTTAGTVAASATTQSGFGSASLTSTSAVRDSSISQSVNVPSDMFSNLDFYFLANNYGYGYNKTELQILSTTGSVLATPFTNNGDINSWTKVSVDLTDYKGTTVVLKFNQHSFGASQQGASTLDSIVFTSTPPVPTAAPTRVGATSDDTTASLAWAAPSSRAVPITSYTVTPYLNGAAQAPTTVSGSPAPTAATLTGLTNGASYIFKVAATNAAGTSPQSAASAPVVPGSVALANAGFEAGLRSWTTAGTTAASTTTHGGFGSAQLTSTSAVRDSSISQSVNVPADMFSNLDFWYMTDNYGSGYNKTELQLLSASGTVMATPFTTGGSYSSWTKASLDLTDYKGMTVVLKFNQHSFGASQQGVSTFDDLVFTSTPPAITAAPTRVGATGEDSAVSVAWVAPSSRAMPITSYTVTPYLAGVAQAPTIVTGSPAPTAATIAGLTNGASYTFTVTATNSAGTSPASVPTAAVVPGQYKIANAGFEAGLRSWETSGTTQASATTHGGFGSAQLTSTSAVRDSSVSQAVNVPADATSNLDFWYTTSNYGSGYNKSELQIVTPTGTVLATPFTTGGSYSSWTKASLDLTDYKGMTVVLKFNQHSFGASQQGVSTFDDLVFTSTPAAITAAPASVGATPANNAAYVNWTAPASPGSTITAYTVTPYLNGAALPPVSVTGSPAATSANVTGLTNGSSYTFKVSATNGVGTSGDSVATAAVIPGPTVVINGSFEAGSSQWTPGGNTPIISATNPHSGSNSMLLGGTNVAQSSIAQAVAVPSSGTPALTYWFKPSSPEGSCIYDFFRVEARTTPGSTAGTLLKSTPLCASTGAAWMTATVDLSAYKGQTIVLWFNMQNDGSGPSSVQLDDVSVG